MKGSGRARLRKRSGADTLANGGGGESAVGGQISFHDMTSSEAQSPKDLTNVKQIHDQNDE